MAEKRKDRNGTVLKCGESQRKDGRYMYRYTDIRGERRCVYALTLNGLREKEQAIRRDLDDGIDHTAGEITVLEWVQRYTAQQKGVRRNTQYGYQFVINVLEKNDFSHKRVKAVKEADAIDFFIKLHDADGYKYSSIMAIRGVLHPAFDMAIRNDIIRRNPFDFRMSKYIANDADIRQALTAEQKERFLNYVLDSQQQSRYYDEILILLGTGMRVSELYGLTRDDLDFEGGSIHVRRQLQRTHHGEYYISPPKTSHSVRDIPMSPQVRHVLQRVLRVRRAPAEEPVIDGCEGFLFLDRNGRPKVGQHMDHAMKRLIDSYNLCHEEKLRVTPHVLRHTFSTDMAAANMRWKSLQYIMGHSKMQTTSDIYTHSTFEMAADDMKRIAGKAK